MWKDPIPTADEAESPEAQEVLEERRAAR
jgi:hypothetical protein